MMLPEPSVLTIDDDPYTCRLVEFLLHSNGYRVLTAFKPADALRCLESSLPQLVLLDVELPEADGLSLLRRLKRDYPSLPVILLSARAEAPSRLAGFDAGADDYIVKPFEPAELLARVQAVLRRSMGLSAPTAPSTIEESGVALDLRSLTVTLPSGGAAVLTPTEARMLHRLMSSPGRVVSTDELAASATGHPSEASSNNLHVYIGRLRRKLGGQAPGGDRIVTVRGSGYRFIAAGTEGEPA